MPKAEECKSEGKKRLLTLQFNFAFMFSLPQTHSPNDIHSSGSSCAGRGDLKTCVVVALVVLEAYWKPSLQDLLARYSVLL
jgi:hypothetical protein